MSCKNWSSTQWVTRSPISMANLQPICPSSALKAGAELGHMGCRFAILIGDLVTHWVEDQFLQLIRTGNDHAYVQDVHVEQHTKVVKVSNERLIFAVPLYLKAYAVLKAVDRMRLRAVGHTFDWLCEEFAAL